MKKLKSVNLAEYVKKNKKKRNSSNIVISNMITREDDCKTKADEVNKILEEIGKKGITLIRNINSRYLNRSRLQLNETEVSVLVSNFKTFEQFRMIN